MLLQVVTLYLKANKWELVSDAEQGEAGDSLVVRPLPESSLVLFTSYDLFAVQMNENKTPSWSLKVDHRFSV